MTNKEPQNHDVDDEFWLKKYNQNISSAFYVVLKKQSFNRFVAPTTIHRNVFVKSTAQSAKHLWLTL